MLENTQKAVEKYHSKQAGDKMKAAKAVLSSVLACKNFIKENEQEDNGGTQRIARELSQIVAPLPMFKNLASDEQALNNIDSKELATERLDKIQAELENFVKEFVAARKKKIHDWVKSHPVLGKLKRSASKRLPKGAYILLFRRPLKSSNKGEVNREISAISIVGAEASECEQANLSANNENLENLSQENLAHESADTSCVATEPSTASEESCDAGNKECETAATHEVSSCETATDAATVVAENSGSSCSNTSESAPASSDANAECQATSDSSPCSAAEETAAQAEGKGSKKGKHKGKGPDAPKTQHPTPELVVRPAPDGKVFTRFRPREFSDDTRMYRTYRGGPPIVGACVIVDGKLSETIGVLPQPAEGGDQLRLLLSISKEAVGKPGRAFIESNEVLNELFQMSKSRAIHKDAYVLLFQRAEDEVDHNASDDDDLDEGAADESSSDESATADHAVESQNSADANLNETGDEEQTDSPPGESGEADDSSSANAASDESETESADSSASGESVHAQEDAPSAAHAASHAVEADESDSDEDDDDDAPVKCELVSKRTDDGRIITRFRTFDFSDARNLYENFKTRRTIVGAAIIRERELIKVLGVVPQVEGRRQLDVLLDCSRQALEKPALDFISADVVLNGLYELANGEYRQKEYEVVLFTETDGRLTIFSTMDKRGKPLSKGPLSEFRIPRNIFDRFKNGPAIVGASVIAEQSAPAPVREMASKSNKDKGGSKSDSRDNNNFRPRTVAPRQPVVMAAFGRTPLKQNVLLSAEILKRLGVDLSILEMAPENRYPRDHRDSRDHRDNRGSRDSRDTREPRGNRT